MHALEVLWAKLSGSFLKGSHNCNVLLIHLFSFHNFQQSTISVSHCSMHQRSFNLRINRLLSAAFPYDSHHELKLNFVSCQCLIYSCCVLVYLCGIAMFGTTVRFKRTGHLGLCEL